MWLGNSERKNSFTGKMKWARSDSEIAFFSLFRCQKNWTLLRYVRAVNSFWKLNSMKAPGSIAFQCQWIYGISVPAQRPKMWVTFLRIKLLANSANLTGISITSLPAEWNYHILKEVSFTRQIRKISITFLLFIVSKRMAIHQCRQQ